ncbi:hypothetical protein ACIO7M_04780 [Streptomyces toxytricini]|uniref:Uncharacterized protein n=1 Tax=Streptomyces toxytricini TaxID=67369 RepID=A0ABW8EB15_STRT5
MVEKSKTRIQVASVESASQNEVVCAVRNIGAEVCTGMQLSPPESPDIIVQISKIIWYGRVVNSLEHAYTAKITLTGAGADRITVGETLESASH